MTDTPESFAYRCLPLNIANAHGWEILNPCRFEACWTGAPGIEGVQIRILETQPAKMPPVSLFGQGVLTFHVEGLFRTESGWNLWVGGPPNALKDAIQPLTGVVETDWAPYTFTMNWRFTRPDTWVRFEREEPICFFFPIRRGYLSEVRPKFEPLGNNPELMSQFADWSRARDEFHIKMMANPDVAASKRWQKHYYRGTDVGGQSHVADHQAKLRVASFDQAPTDTQSISRGTTMVEATNIVEPTHTQTSARNSQEIEPIALTLRKREWLLQVLEQHRRLAPGGRQIERRVGLERQEFLERYYALNRPVILVGDLDDWPALARWTPSYLKRVVGSAIIEYQGERTKSAGFEMFKDQHRRKMPFDQFIDFISGAEGNASYITAYNSVRNTEALSVLDSDLRELDHLLVSDPNQHMMKWIGPAGTLTALHHDLTNNMIAQFVGRKHIKMIPPAEVIKLYNHQHVFSQIADLEDPALARGEYPALADLLWYDTILAPGEAIFVPIGWWHQVRSLDFSTTITYTNFHFRNDWYESFPAP
jgi:hypothetical protein